MRLSIVVPAWNEGRRIAGTLKRLRATARPDSVEIIVVDGGQHLAWKTPDVLGME